jgi:L-ribulose-5-phosphate 3-epimerase
MNTNRRNFLLNATLAASGLLVGDSIAAIPHHQDDHADPFTGTEKDAFKISIFSKNLQWLGYTEMSVAAAEMGFDGIDLTVRPQGHVSPERVSEDLPAAIEAIRKAGLEAYMITTAISDASEPYAEAILKTASSLGIRHYRMGWLHYDESKSIEDNLKRIEDQLRKLAALNKKYAIYGEYQNHSGAYFGAPIWDLFSVLNHINSPWIGAQYDILHATVEGANSWPIGLKLLKPYIRSIDIKDFQWTKKDSTWKVEVVPLGEGLVDYKNYLGLLKQYGVAVPVSMHFEYSLGGAEHGATTLTTSKESVMASMKADCITFKKYLNTADLLK